MDEVKTKIARVTGQLQLMNFATLTEDGRPWVRYVVGKSDDNLVFRFCTHKETRKVAQIKKNANVHISLGARDMETAEHWVQVQGVAEISTDSDERHAFWFDALRNYFTGSDDPNYCIIIVRPSRIEYGTMGSMIPEIWEREK